MKLLSETVLNCAEDPRSHRVPETDVTGASADRLCGSRADQ